MPKISSNFYLPLSFPFQLLSLLIVHIHRTEGGGIRNRLRLLFDWYAQRQWYICKGRQEHLIRKSINVNLSKGLNDWLTSWLNLPPAALNSRAFIDLFIRANIPPAIQKARQLSENPIKSLLWPSVQLNSAA